MFDWLNYTDEWLIYLRQNYGHGMVFIFWLIFVFLLSALIFLLITLFSRFAKISDQGKIKSLTPIFQDFVLDILYGTEDLQSKKLDTFAQKTLQSPFRKQLFIKILREVHKGLEGDMAVKLRALYMNLKLDAFSSRKLHSGQWHIKAEGLNELREMGIKTAIPKIKKLVNDREANVRGNAQLALLELEEGTDRLSFLIDLPYHLTEWEQLRLYESLKARDGDKIASFSALYASQNYDVVRFGIRMTAYFGHINDIPNLKSCLTHPVEAVRISCIEALTRLGDFQHQTILLERYTSESLRVQKAILAYLSATGEKSIQLLLDALTSGDHTLSLEAAKQLRRNYDQGFVEQLTAGLFLPNDVKLKLAHAADPRLNTL